MDFVEFHVQYVMHFRVLFQENGNMLQVMVMVSLHVQAVLSEPLLSALGIYRQAQTKKENFRIETLTFIPGIFSQCCWVISLFSV